MRKYFGFTSVFVILFVFVVTSMAEENIVVTEGGLKYIDLEAGAGPMAEVGKIAVVHFIGWLDNNGSKGKEFFNSRDAGRPISFKVGTANVMQGWNIGVIGMKAGGKRRLMIPYQLGYGVKSIENVIPAKADLIYELELVEVK